MAISDYRDADGSQIAAYHFEYDSLGRLIRSTEYGASGTITQRTEHLYDEFGRLSSQSWIIQGDSFSESYVYDDPDPDVEDDTADGSLKQMTTAIGSTIDFTYDVLKRLQKTTAKSATGSTILTSAYSYYNLGTTNSVTQTTSQVKFHNVRTANETLLTGAMYTYDEVGNIIQISESSSPYNPIVKYTYDVQNQLIKELYYDGDGNADTNITATYEYTYDTAGNILSESKNGTVTKTYTYGNSQWNDLLTKFNGTTITYDTIGNPRGYENGKSSYSFTWFNGRRLSQATVDNAESYYIGYDYDIDGIRTKKSVTVDSTGATTTHYYITQNGKVVRETIGTGTTAQVLDFIYDSNGKPFALKYTNGTATPVTYYYVVNLQGDVVKLITESGAEVASYTYNAWGEVLTATGTMAEINPLRYRGYYYDTEIGFYYLQSRYYDPVLHRFINADSLASTGQGVLGYNMFAYCNNNPAIFSDPSGSSAIGIIDISDIIKAIIDEVQEDYTKDEYITDQDAVGIGNLRLGASFIGHGGCGVVSTYNALLKLGRSPSLKAIAKSYERRGSLNFCGWLGISPWNVTEWFNEAGYQAIQVEFTPDTYPVIQGLSSTADACILWYAFDDPLGAHFVFFEYDHDKKGYWIYNSVEDCGLHFTEDIYSYAYKNSRFYAMGIFIYD